MAPPPSAVQHRALRVGCRDVLAEGDADGGVLVCGLLFRVVTGVGAAA